MTPPNNINHTPHQINEINTILTCISSNIPQIRLSGGKLVQATTKMEKLQILEKDITEANLRVLELFHQAVTTLPSGQLAIPVTNPKNIFEKIKRSYHSNQLFRNNPWVLQSLNIILEQLDSNSTTVQSTTPAKRIEQVISDFKKKLYNEQTKKYAATLSPALAKLTVPKKATSLFKRIISLFLSAIGTLIRFILRNGSRAEVWCFEKAVNLNPTKAQARFHLAKAYNKMKRHKEACTQMMLANQLDPKNRDIAHALGLHMIKNSSIDKDVIPYFTETAVKAPKNPYYALWLGTAFALKWSQLSPKERQSKTACKMIAEAYSHLEKATKLGLKYVASKAAVFIYQQKGPLIARSFLDQIAPNFGFSRFNNMEHKDLKRSFAHMHADGDLIKEKHLKKWIGGGLQQGTYFDHFITANTPRFSELAGFATALRDSYLRATIQNSFRSGEKKPEWAKEMAVMNLGCVKNLQPGQSHIIQANWHVQGRKANHIAAYIIRKQADGKYTFSIINSGAGIANHYQAKSRSNRSKIKVKPDYTIKNIDADRLCREVIFEQLSRWTLHLDTPSSYNGFYNKIESLLGKPHVETNVIPDEDLMTQQRSGTCASSIFPAMLRTYLPLKKYKKFMFVMKTQSLIHFYKSFKDSLPTDKEAKDLLKVAVGNYKRRQAKMKRLFLNQHASLLKPDEQVAINEVISSF